MGAQVPHSRRDACANNLLLSTRSHTASTPGTLLALQASVTTSIEAAEPRAPTHIDTGARRFSSKRAHVALATRGVSLRYGVEKIDATNEPFDPALHEAV